MTCNIGRQFTKLGSVSHFGIESGMKVSATNSKQVKKSTNVELRAFYVETSEYVSTGLAASILL